MSDAPITDGGSSAADSMSKMLDHFNDRLRTGNLKLIERYLNSEIVIQVHFHLVGEVAHQYVAHFERAHTQEASGNEHPRIFAIAEEKPLTISSFVRLYQAQDLDRAFPQGLFYSSNGFEFRGGRKTNNDE